MMKPLFPLWCLIVLVGTSCTGTAPRDIPLTSLVSEPVELGDTTVLMEYRYRIQRHDSLLFVMDLHGAMGYYLHVYHYPDGRLINSIGQNGRGPEEMLGATSFDIERDSVFLYDPGTNRMIVYALESIASPRPFHRVDTIYPFSSDYSPILTYDVTPEGVLPVHNTKNRSIVELTNEGKLTRKIPLPDYGEDAFASVPEAYIPSVWNSYFEYSEPDGVMVNATQLGDLLEIYHIKRDTMISVIGEGGLPGVLEVDGGMSVGKIDGFYDLGIVDGKIYALFSGRSREESVLADETLPTGADRIHVYDLTGKLLEIYALDRHINGFSIDRDTRSILAVDSNAENPVFVFNR